MTMKRKHRCKKRTEQFLIFYIFISILFVASYTLSRYVEVISKNGEIDIAKFNVVINDVHVKDGAPIQFNISKSTTFVNGKIAPSSTGYFEFKIDPSETEVSLEYELIFDLSQLAKEFKLTHFTVNDGENQEITENVVKNDLLLPSLEHGFTKDDAISVKVYWSWEVEEDIVNPDINEYENKNIDVIAIVRQKIN